MFDLVEHDLGKEDVVGYLVRSAQSAAVLVVREDRLEARPMSIEEILAASFVPVLAPLVRITEQRFRVPIEYRAPEVEPLAADVDADQVRPDRM